MPAVEEWTLNMLQPNANGKQTYNIRHEIITHIDFSLFIKYNTTLPYNYISYVFIIQISLHVQRHVQSSHLMSLLNHVKNYPIKTKLLLTIYLKINFHLQSVHR